MSRVDPVAGLEVVAATPGPGRDAAVRPGRHGMCPSAPGRSPDGAIIGMVGSDGTVAPVVPPLPVTPALRAVLGSQPERLFRIAAPCRAGACAQWDGAGCGLVGRLRTELADKPVGAVERCGIRADCVWFKDSGLQACRICPSVVYNPSA